MRLRELLPTEPIEAIKFFVPDSGLVNKEWLSLPLGEFLSINDACVQDVLDNYFNGLKGGQEIPSALIWTKDAVCHFHEDYDGTMCLESLPRNPWDSTPNPVDKE